MGSGCAKGVQLGYEEWSVTGTAAQGSGESPSLEGFRAVWHWGTGVHGGGLGSAEGMVSGVFSSLNISRMSRATWFLVPEAVHVTGTPAGETVGTEHLSMGPSLQIIKVS